MAKKCTTDFLNFGHILVGRQFHAFLSEFLVSRGVSVSVDISLGICHFCDDDTYSFLLFFLFLSCVLKDMLCSISYQIH